MLRLEMAIGVLATHQSGPVALADGLFQMGRDVAYREPDAAVLSDGTSITVGVVDLFEQDHDVALMKMDIEGGEWSILTDPRLSELKADAIVLEWHAAGCPEPDAREAAIRLLRAARYTGQSETEDFGHRGVIWAWREDGAASA